MAKGFAMLVYFLIAKFLSVGAQLNLYIAKNDVNSHLKLNFNFDLYMIRNNEPATLLKETRGFYDFMSPLQSSVKGVKMTWFSSPQSTYYSLKLLSSDQLMMPNPVVSIATQGVVPHSPVSFYISLDCTGQKAGLVDVSMKLNYTKIISTSVKSSSVKTLLVLVKKHCDKTVKTPDKETDKGINHWSRGAIVGLSAGITIFLCLSVGVGLLCKHYMKQRKLKMEFEDDFDELEGKRQFGLKKVRSLPIHKPAPPSTSPPVVYSPKRPKLRVVSRTRQRSETNGSDTSTLELICKEEPDDDVSGHRDSSTSQELAWPSGLSEILLNPIHLEMKEIIGTGASGDVYRGLLRVTNENEAHVIKEVAVQTLTDGLNSDDNKKLLEAIVFTKELDHPNLLKPFGVILNPSSSLQVVTPYMKYSSLDKFLRQNGNSLSKFQSLDIALKIAEVMNYLTSQNYVHKNFSSKECLIGEEFDVKVSCCQKQTTCAKWLAPECLSGDTFSEKSVVWSFGVILWELTTCGELPYAEVEAHCLLDSLKSGNRLHQPLHCSDELYSVMLKCWCLSPVDRPSLQWLVDWLSMCVQTLEKNSTVC